MDQITEGQVQFVKLDKHFDTILIGRGEKSRKYSIHSGKSEMEEHLKEQFPDDVKAIEEYFKIMKVVHLADVEACLKTSRAYSKQYYLHSASGGFPKLNAFLLFSQISARKTHFLVALKLLPQWVALFLLKSGIANLCSSVFRLAGTNAAALANSLTSNKDLHIIFNYFFYGVKLLVIDVYYNNNGSFTGYERHGGAAAGGDASQLEVLS